RVYWYTPVSWSARSPCKAALTEVAPDGIRQKCTPSGIGDEPVASWKPGTTMVESPRRNVSLAVREGVADGSSGGSSSKSLTPSRPTLPIDRASARRESYRRVRPRLTPSDTYGAVLCVSMTAPVSYSTTELKFVSSQEWSSAGL